MVKSSDKAWSTRKGNGKPVQYPCLENLMNGMKRQKDMTLKDEPLIIRSVSNMLLDKNREIAAERIKRLSQSRNDASCGCVVVKVID